MKTINKITKSLVFSAACAFSAASFSQPGSGIDLSLVNINANAWGNNSDIVVLEAGGSPSNNFPDPQSCNGYGATVTAYAALQVSDPNFKVMYAIALAALLEDKLIDIYMTDDCEGVGFIGIPVVSSITVKK